jgi:hypothetical protein
MYSLDEGLTWIPIPKTADFLTGTSYVWTVPKTWGNKNKCLVKVIGYKANGVEVGADISNATFTIQVVKLTSPDGEDTVTCGVPKPIIWTVNETKNDVAKVKLYYTKDKGVNWTQIGISPGDSGRYDLWIPTCAKTKTNCCKVKVELKDALGNILGTDANDGYFTIRP